MRMPAGLCMFMLNTCTNTYVFGNGIDVITRRIYNGIHQQTSVLTFALGTAYMKEISLHQILSYISLRFLYISPKANFFFDLCRCSV